MGKQHTCWTAKWPLPAWTHRPSTKLSTAYQGNREAETQLAEDHKHSEGHFGMSALQRWKPQGFENMNQAPGNGDWLKNAEIATENGSNNSFVVFTFAFWFFLLLGFMSSICPLKPWQLETLLSPDEIWQSCVLTWLQTPILWGREAWNPILRAVSTGTEGWVLNQGYGVLKLWDVLVSNVSKLNM